MWSISRPNENQRILYNGHKKVHAIKFQSVIAPNGLVANFVGQLKGSGMLAMPGLLDAMQRSSVRLYDHNLSIYGDPAYPLRPCSKHHFEELF